MPFKDNLLYRSVVIKETFSGSWWEQMQTHSETLCRVLEFLRKRRREDGRSQRSHGCQENTAHRISSGGLTGAHRDWSNHHGACMDLHYVLWKYVLVVHLGFPVKLQTLAVQVSLALFLVLGMFFLLFCFIFLPRYGYPCVGVLHIVIPCLVDISGRPSFSEGNRVAVVWKKGVDCGMRGIGKRWKYRWKKNK